jgi:DNA-binding transcriptional LysR family regulator
VVRAQGFGAAAKVLKRSTSSVSCLIADLEAALQAQLLVRTTRRLRLTETGALYLRHAEELLEKRRSLHEAIVELTGQTPRGYLRVSMPVSVGERLLGPRLKEFTEKYPELRLELELSDRRVSLMQGGFDLAIRVGKLNDSSLRSQQLGRVISRLVASPAYLKKHGTPAHPRDLAEHRSLALGPFFGTQEWQLYRGRSSALVTLRPILQTSSPTLLAQLACAGLGVARVVEWVAQRELECGELVELLPQWRCDDPRFGGAPVHILFAQGADAVPPLKSRVFVDFVREIIARDPVVQRGAVPKSRRSPT